MFNLEVYQLARRITGGSRSAQQDVRGFARSDAAPETAGGGGLKISRVFDAPRRLVWKEWTEPSRFADWFGGTETEVPLSTVSIDLMPGGAWRATTLSYGPDCRDICWEGEYLEIIEP